MLLFQGCLSRYWRQVATRTMSWRLNSIRNIFALLTVCMVKRLRLMERLVMEILKNYVFEQQLVAFSCGWFFWANFTNIAEVDWHWGNPRTVWRVQYLASNLEEYGHIRYFVHLELMICRHIDLVQQNTRCQTSNIRRTESQNSRCFSSRLAVVFVLSIEAMG